MVHFQQLGIYVFIIITLFREYHFSYFKVQNLSVVLICESPQITIIICTKIITHPSLTVDQRGMA